MWPVGPKKMGLFFRFFVIFMHFKKHFFKKSEWKKIPIWDYPKRQKKIPRDLQKSQVLG